MPGVTAGYDSWDGGLISVTAEDLATITWTAGELDDLLFDTGAQSSSAETSPSLGDFMMPPMMTTSSMAPVSSTQSSAGTSPSLDAFAVPPMSMPSFVGSVSDGTVKLPSTATTPSSISTPGLAIEATDLKRKRDRERNTEAARRYRKRRVDETDELRARLDAMTKERDTLRLQLIKAETEADLLRKLVSQPKVKS